MGHAVTGSDLKASLALEHLAAAGVQVSVGHRAENLGSPDVVAISSAVPKSNPELVAARERGIPVLSRAQILAAVVATRRTVAVAGTHGKTTSCSMLALVLVEAGLRPSFIVGGELNESGTGAVWDEGEWLAVEADESDGTFLEIAPEVAVVTNVEPDHLEHYGSFEALIEAFNRFITDAPGPKIVCADDPVAASLGAQAGATTYGVSRSATYRMVEVERRRSSTSFTLEHEGHQLGRLELPVPGLHNATNAAGAIATALSLGADVPAAQRALARFTGVARRFQFRGESGGVSFVDDYAHLPGEVVPTLAAARAGGWARIVCVFQPHRYSRTATLWRDFADAFDQVDVLFVTDIYPAGERPRPGVSGELVAQAVRDAHPGRQVVYVPSRAALRSELRRTLAPGDLCLTLGAGDLTSLPDELIAEAAW
jgi:UDP-N-acetylmuramate--alanine ligase